MICYPESEGLQFLSDSVFAVHISQMFTTLGNIKQLKGELEVIKENLDNFVGRSRGQLQTLIEISLKIWREKQPNRGLVLDGTIYEEFLRCVLVRIC